MVFNKFLYVVNAKFSFKILFLEGISLILLFWARKKEKENVENICCNSCIAIVLDVVSVTGDIAFVRFGSLVF